MMTINKEYFEKMHTFRLEWETGKNGYLHWYVDNKFRFGIEQSGLEEFGTEIPKEPSYVIINTAISNSWGFPNPPWGCEEYDCKRTDACGFNPGFCKTLPAKMYVDSVRVYQNKKNPNQTVGCNPKEYPTKKWILAHEYRYKNKDETHALKPIVAGGGYCLEDKECGEGYCSFRRCICDKKWTGPKCLVPEFKDDSPDWETSDWIPFSVPYIPSFLAVLGIVFCLALLSTAIMFRKWQFEKDSYFISKSFDRIAAGYVENNHHYAPIGGGGH